jgi:hypothetical protein
MRNKLIAALAVAAVPLTAQAATVTAVQGNGGIVSFAAVSEDGCVSTMGQLAVLDSHAGDDKEGVLAVFVSYDSCTGAGGGGYGTGDLAFAVNGLSSARAEGTLVLAAYSGEEVTLDLDLTWTGTGAVSASGGFNSKDEWAMDFQWNQARAANMTGTLFVDGEPADLADAMLIQGAAASIYR